ncbi:hypothetical protein EMIT0P218_150070 [Pseudomonas sp. IT-P218]
MSCGKKMAVRQDLKRCIGDLRKNSLRQKLHVKLRMVSGRQKAKPAALMTNGYGILHSAADTFYLVRFRCSCAFSAGINSDPCHCHESHSPNKVVRKRGVDFDSQKSSLEARFKDSKNSLAYRKSV